MQEDARILSSRNREAMSTTGYAYALVYDTVIKPHVLKPKN